jgi:hypothetical protein
LRCGVGLGGDDVDCPSCGANREVEMAVAYELDPTIAQLKRWLFVLGGLSIGMGLVMYLALKGAVPTGTVWAVVLPNVVMGAVLMAMATVARAFPLAVPITALVLLGLTFLANLIADPASALMPSLGNLVRLGFLLVIVAALQSGYKARQIRTIADAKLAAARRG